MSNGKPARPRVAITSSMLMSVRKFTDEVLEETYNRYGEDEETCRERIFVGKLAELAFSKYLTRLGVSHETSGMFAVYEGTTNVDAYDFVVASTGETVDIKTAHRHYHSRILVPYGRNGQWEQMPKDYYVGVRLLRLINSAGGMDYEGNRDPFGIIWGYISREDPAWQGPRHFGRGPAMWASLSSLKPISELVELMRH